ncbi:PmoA family protein [Bacteroidota bacterium]
MKRAINLLALLIFLNVLVFGQKIEFLKKENQIDVMVNGNLFTTYCFGHHLSKPILYPVHSPSGEMVTRRYPFEIVEGESHDHPHHTGVFFTYGSRGEVNGNSYWANRHDRPPLTMDKKIPGIRQVKLLKMKGGNNQGKLITLNHWVDSADNPILEEKRTMDFYVSKDEYTIDFTILLKALDSDVTFEDTKEGMFGIRVAEWMTENSTEYPQFSKGEYLNAEGQRTTENVWGRRSAWVRLESEKDGKKIGIAIFHHPESVNYPTYWHARGYGCFTANPIGQYQYQKETGVKNPQYRTYTLKKGESGLFKFRMLIYEGPRTKKDMDLEFEEFTKN